MTTRSILELPERVAALPQSSRERIERLFHIARVDGRCVIPDTMGDWVRAHMGALNEVEAQTVVRVTNRVTWEGALFNPLRGRRPVQMTPPSAAPAHDIFADPLRTTAEDVFGRVRGAHCVTTSNISRWDGMCAVEIFDEPDPLAFTRAHLRDYLRVGRTWARHANAHDPAARYFIWMWNGGPKAGASIVHAHAQMALGRGQHYARVEGLREAALRYRASHGASYFDDLYAAHDALELGFDIGPVRGFVNLAPQRTKDITLLGDAIDDALADAMHDALRALIDRTGTSAFNAVVIAPPLFDDPVDTEKKEDWRGFPVMARVCDRGSAAMLSSDIGALDVYAHNTISADPFVVRAAFGDFPGAGEGANR
jgi:hypothetical protein